MLIPPCVCRFSLSASSCITPYLYQDRVQWGCIINSNSNNNSSRPASGPTSSSNSSGGNSSVSTSAALAGAVLSGVLSSSVFGVCPVPSGGWDMCAPLAADKTRWE